MRKKIKLEVRNTRVTFSWWAISDRLWPFNVSMVRTCDSNCCLSSCKFNCQGISISRNTISTNDLLNRVINTTVLDLWRLRTSSREIGPSGAPMPIPLNLLLSTSNSSSALHARYRYKHQFATKMSQPHYIQISQMEIIQRKGMWYSYLKMSFEQLILTCLPFQSWTIC